MEQNQSSLKTQRNILAILLLISLTFTFYIWQKSNQKQLEQATVIEKQDIDLSEFEAELELARFELEQYRSGNAELDSLLNDANKKLSEREKRIKDLMASGVSKTKINQAIQKELEAIRKSKIELENEIERLNAENQRLKNQNDSLNNELGENVTARRKLESKVKLAEQLRIDRVSIKTFKKKALGKGLTETTIARKTIKIESCFAVLENPVAPAGDRKISLRILNADGATLSSSSNATIVDVETNKTITTTANFNLDYQGQTEEICLAWEDESTQLKPGNYTVEVYINGLLVFASAFSLN